MKIYYDSKSGTTEKLVELLNFKYPTIKLDELTQNDIVNEEIILFTYTWKKASIPEFTNTFVNNNQENIIYVHATGGIDHLINFGQAAIKIGNILNIKDVSWTHKEGTSSERELVKQLIQNRINGKIK